MTSNSAIGVFMTTDEPELTVTSPPDIDLLETAAESVIVSIALKLRYCWSECRRMPSMGGMGMESINSSGASSSFFFIAASNSTFLTSRRSSPVKRKER